MRIGSLFSLSLTSLMHSRVRTWLTIIGITIGIAAIVSIVSISDGMTEAISGRLGDLGSDTITITPGYVGRNAESFRQQFYGLTRSTAILTDKDIMAIKLVPNIIAINPVVSGKADMGYMSEKSTVDIYGVDPEVWSDVATANVIEGKYLSSGDKKVAVLGYSMAKNLFEAEVTINKQIKLEGVTFRVLGILEETGSFGVEDNSVYIPIKDARDILGVDEKEVSSIVVKTAPGKSDGVEVKIEQRLFMSRHVTEDNRDFTIFSPKVIQETIGDVLNAMGFFMAGIAGISLAVGAIGIANTMFVSVLERTKQIGTLKALGATNSEIKSLFLIESGLLGSVGGILGILIGSGLSLAIGSVGLELGASGQFSTIITPELLVFSLLFSLVVGMLSGYFPADRASKLQPVEALRYE